MNPHIHALTPPGSGTVPPGFVCVSEFKSVDAGTFAGSRFMSWADFCTWFTKHIVVERKEGIGLFNFARFGEKKWREDANVLDVSALVLDLDDVSQDALNALVHRLSGYAYAYATTHSHGREGNCYRIVVQLTRPVACHEWRSFAAAVRVHLGSDMDDSCLPKRSQSYYRTSCPPSRAALKEAGTSPGTPVDVDAWLAQAPVMPRYEAAAPTAPHEVIARFIVPESKRRVPTRDEIQAFIDQSGPQVAQDARCMFVTGEAWGAPKQRDYRLHMLAYALLCVYPWVHPEQTAMLAARSCAAVEREDKAETTVDWVARKLRSKIGPAAAKAHEIAEGRRMVEALTASCIARTR